MNLIVVWPVVSGARDVDELENQRPTSDNTTSSGQEISADDVFQY